MVELTANVERARDAARRYAWAEAFELFGAEDAQEPLGPDDLVAMAEAAWWIGKMRHCIALRERAHAAYLKAGEDLRAAKVATDLADHHSDLHEPSVASAWIQRATKLLEGHPESAEHGWLALANSFANRMDGSVALPFAVEAAEIGGRHGDKDLFALGIAMQGVTLVFGDQIDPGMTLLEEATVGAVSGELGPFATGVIYCMMITASSQLADWQRAGQWTEAAKRWCERQAINGFPGVCRVHRAEIMRLRGSLSEAAEEARLAAVELSSFNLLFTAFAFKELGEVRLRMGETDAAEDAFRQAHEMGVTPQPGLALVQLQRGKPDAAARALRRALADETSAPLDRAKLLPTQVEVALIVGDVQTAHGAATELNQIATAYESPALQAQALSSTAAVQRADGALDQAEQAARRAVRIFQETDLTYEAARTSLLLGQVYAAQGDTDGAQFEISSALSTLERIGALPEADRARSLLDEITPEGSDSTRVEKTFLFSDIVRSTHLIDAVGDEAWAELLKWHDETLRKLFAEHGGDEVSHTTEGFLVAFENANDAILCAKSIQTALAQHTRVHGVAPLVRIGVHAAEAAQVQGNYHGKGVHETARIGAVADAGEILVSASTLESVTSEVTATNERQVTLQGVAEPMTVASLVWQ
jgi:class 3 adenylate cyclase